jgi:hypothetical protein
VTVSHLYPLTLKLQRKHECSLPLTTRSSALARRVNWSVLDRQWSICLYDSRKKQQHTHEGDADVDDYQVNVEILIPISLLVAVAAFTCFIETASLMTSLCFDYLYKT